MVSTMLGLVGCGNGAGKLYCLGHILICIIVGQRFKCCVVGSVGVVRIFCLSPIISSLPPSL